MGLPTKSSTKTLSPIPIKRRCTPLKLVAHPCWADRSTPVIPVRGNTRFFTPVETGIVPNVRPCLQSDGSMPDNRISCLSLTSTSSSPCPNNSNPSPGKTRPSSITSSLKPPHKRSKILAPIKNTSVPGSALSQCSTPGHKPSYTIPISTVSSPVAASPKMEETGSPLKTISSSTYTYCPACSEVSSWPSWNRPFKTTNSPYPSRTRRHTPTSNGSRHTCTASSGTSTAKRPWADLNRCSPTWDDTPIVSPSPMIASWE